MEDDRKSIISAESVSSKKGSTDDRTDESPNAAAGTLERNINNVQNVNRKNIAGKGKFKQPQAEGGGSRDQSAILPPVLVNRGYKLGEKIGSGAFSEVYKATHKDHKDRDFAVKIIQLDKVPKNWKEKCLRTEMKILKKLKHPHIIRLWNLVKTRRSVFIFMDLAQYSIMDFMKKNDRACPENKARLWFSQICGALVYMHNIGYAHRDLKNDNILLDQDESAKLTDFSFSQFTYAKDARQPTYSATTCGTRGYMAPEVMDPPYDAKQADIWSFGVCLFEMLTYQKPFDETLPEQELRRLQMERIWEFPIVEGLELPGEVKDLVKKMLDPDSLQRPSASQILKHEWLAKKAAQEIKN